VTDLASRIGLSRSAGSSEEQVSCFIARKFDEADVERLAKDVIEPIVRNAAVRLVKLPGPGSPEELTTSVRKAIDGSDFVIADLTYNSMNVHYEAGLAERPGKYVIYTCRADHVRKGDVAFDLSTRAILTWKKESDAQFASELATAVADVLRRLRATRIDRSEENAFAALTDTEKLAQLQESFKGQFLKAGYSNGWLYLRKALLSADVRSAMQLKFIGWRPSSDPRHVVWGFFGTTLGKTIPDLLETVRGNGDLQTLVGWRTSAEFRPDEHIFIVTLNAPRRQELRDLFPNYNYDAEQGLLSLTGENKRSVFGGHVHPLHRARTVKQFAGDIHAIIVKCDLRS